MSRQTRGFAFLVALLVTACAVTEETGVTAEQWDAVRRWLTCEECVDGELLEVESIGIRTVSVLVSTLEDLPEDAKLNLKRRFGVAWGSVAHTGADSTVYVDTHLANAIARTQVRSALALVVFERWDYVRMALDSAQAWEYREDVVEEIQEILFDPAASLHEWHHTWTDHEHRGLGARERHRIPATLPYGSSGHLSPRGRSLHHIRRNRLGNQYGRHR